jgi:hypothetical protein
MARAPVYRYLDAKNALFGLALGEALVLLTVAWPALLTLPPLAAAAVLAGAYVGIRLLGRGRPEGFIQYWVAWQSRNILTSGYLSPAARIRIPRFPFGVYGHRDVGPRGRA